jgi:hypothetical protein
MMTTPAEERWKEMVAQLALRTGMSPFDVEAATEGRIKAAEVADLLAPRTGPEALPPAADGAPPAESTGAGESE